MSSESDSREVKNVNVELVGVEAQTEVGHVDVGIDPLRSRITGHGNLQARHSSLEQNDSHARSYLDTAVEFFLLREWDSEREGRDSRIDQFLIGRVIELALKALLSYHGIEETRLSRREFGHHLDKLLQEALARNICVLNEVEIDRICLLSEPYSRTLLHYWQEVGYVLLNPVVLRDAALKLIDAAGQAIQGASQWEVTRSELRLTD